MRPETAPRATIRLHIERLVLDGLDLSRAEAEGVRAQLEAELTRLLQSGGLSPELLSGAALPALRVGAVEASGAENLGAGVARAVYGGVGDGQGEPGE